MFSNREILRKLIADLAIRRGPIILSNGSVSAYYFDCKRVTLNCNGAVAVGDAIADVIEQLENPPIAIGGLTLGADPIVGAAMLRAYARGHQLQGFYVRKEPKQHGTKNYIENEPPSGSRVVIVDDVVTTGQSTIRAIERTQDAGCDIVAVITLVDRLEGGSDNIRTRVPNAKYIPLFNLSDFPEIERIKLDCPMNSETLSPVGSA
jgi:orotate phosphoribosyltransferase